MCPVGSHALLSLIRLGAVVAYPSPTCHSFFDWHHIWPTFSNFEPENYRDITWPNMNSKYHPGTKIQIVIGVINLKAYFLIHFSDYLILTVSDPNLGFRMRKIIKAFNNILFNILGTVNLRVLFRGFKTDLINLDFLSRPYLKFTLPWWYFLSICF